MEVHSTASMVGDSMSKDKRVVEYKGKSMRMRKRNQEFKLKLHQALVKEGIDEKWVSEKVVVDFIGFDEEEK